MLNRKLVQEAYRALADPHRRTILWVLRGGERTAGDLAGVTGLRPAAWVAEDVTPLPRNIYGVTKAAAEDLWHLFHRNQGLACIVVGTPPGHIPSTLPVEGPSIVD